MKTLILIITILLISPFVTTSQAEVTEWKYKLIKEGYQVKCTEKDRGKCITWNWVKVKKNKKD